MTPDALREMLRVRPFEWFRIHLTDGTVYEVRHPDSVLVGPRTAVVGVGDPDQPHYEKLVTVSLLHITQLEPNPQHPAQNNGPTG